MYLDVLRIHPEIWHQPDKRSARADEGSMFITEPAVIAVMSRNGADVAARAGPVIGP